MQFECRLHQVVPLPGRTPALEHHVVIGRVVHSTPRTGLTMKTDGSYGIRVNHMLDVQVVGFTVSKQ